MNIFALDPDPAICASMHCDQHLSKMILESAQMLSTVCRNCSSSPAVTPVTIYKTTHQNHPCTKWAEESRANAAWLISLCKELNEIRMSLGAASHSSMIVVETVEDWLELEGTVDPEDRTPFVFCGPDQIKYQLSLSVHEKYQQLYKYKQQEWLGTRTQMSYKNRPLPSFLSDYSHQIVYG